MFCKAFDVIKDAWISEAKDFIYRFGLDYGNSEVFVQGDDELFFTVEAPNHNTVTGTVKIDVTVSPDESLRRTAKAIVKAIDDADVEEHAEELVEVAGIPSGYTFLSFADAVREDVAHFEKMRKQIEAAIKDGTLNWG